MNKLKELRKQIDVIDKSLAELFEKRMNIAKEIGEFKKENNLPIFDSSREEEVIKKNVTNIKDEELKEYYTKLLHVLMDMSKDYQNK